MIIPLRTTGGILCLLLYLSIITSIFTSPAKVFALRENGKYDERQTAVSPDSETGGWFINLGITGARGRMSPEWPKEIEVAYVFKRTPAAGKLEVGDRIVGANGRKFVKRHKFGWGMDNFGYEGPLMELGDAINLSQGRQLNGKLTLDVEREGEELEVEIQLPTEYGSFSETYPFNCPKSDRIFQELCEYLDDQQGSNGSWARGRPHVDAFAALALLASGESKYRSNVKSAMRYFADQTDDTIRYGGLDCWKYGLFGVCLAEYYLATEEKWVLKELEEINRWLVKAQFVKSNSKGMGAGGWGHRPKNRPEGNGYGAISAITAQAMAAWSLMQECGIEIDEERYELAHEFLVRGTNNIGYVWYKDSNGGDDRYADMGRTGAAAVAHAVNATGDRTYQRYAEKSARCIGKNPKTFPDTHASPILGMGWTALGASFDERAIRELMDEHVWYFTLAHCPDGSFYYQPNRDNNPQDYRAAPRLSASAVTALILAIKHRSLRVTGAGKFQVSVSNYKNSGRYEQWQLRTFRSAEDQNKSVQARFLAYDPESQLVSLRLRDGRTKDIPIVILSEADQNYVKIQWAKQNK